MTAEIAPRIPKITIEAIKQSAEILGLQERAARMGVTIPDDMAARAIAIRQKKASSISKRGT